MVNILNVLEEIKNETNYFSIKPTVEVVAKANIAFKKGIDCIINTQYKQHGVLTGWCAQHDEKTLMPTKARAYELPSLSGAESAKIVLLLMTIENPSPEIINAVNSAYSWFEKVKITGLREDRVYNENGKVIDKIMVPDENAAPIWARFMELEDNKPFFCDRDGVKKYSITEISAERRNGYGWYTDKPKEVLKKYARWAEKYSPNVIPQEEVKKKPINEYQIQVAKDGSGDFTNIQDAVYAAKAFPYQRVIINIKNGVYNEKVRIPEWNTFVSLIGESKEETIITYNDYFDKINLGRNSTFYTPTLLVEGDDFYATNLTVENTAGEVGQAIALSVVANRAVINNCNIVGNQDTLYASGEGNKQYFKDCFITGTADFIFGNATVLFENCEIQSKRNSYITAASTSKNSEFGFVFLNCKLTASENVSEVYLGRPWRKYAKTVFINCEMGNHILPEGWHNWNNIEAEETSFYAEYNNSENRVSIENRVNWSHQLTKNEAENYSKSNILGTANWYEIF
jgi:pectinesterase